jgi:hypothetical protein
MPETKLGGHTDRKTKVCWKKVLGKQKLKTASKTQKLNRREESEEEHTANSTRRRRKNKTKEYNTKLN